MASFASQAALRSHYEDLIDETEHDLTEKLSSAVSWFKQVSQLVSLSYGCLVDAFLLKQLLRTYS